VFAAISDWVRHLVFLILLAVFVELVLPQSSLQKYARAVFGLLIVLAMLDPLRALLTADFSAQAFDQNLAGPLLGASDVAPAYATAAYDQELGQAIGSDIAASFGVQVQAIQVVTSTASDGSETVNTVYATVPVVRGQRSDLLRREIQAQISELLGLPLAAIHVQ